jgi:hypothetical protein
VIQGPVPRLAPFAFSRAKAPLTRRLRVEIFAALVQMRNTPALALKSIITCGDEIVRVGSVDCKKYDFLFIT